MQILAWKQNTAEAFPGATAKDWRILQPVSVLTRQATWTLRPPATGATFYAQLLRIWPETGRLMNERTCGLVVPCQGQMGWDGERRPWQSTAKMGQTLNQK